MKNLFGRDNLINRVSSVDGTIHLNRGLRDVHDAIARAERARKQMENMRRLQEDARKRNKI